MLDFAALLINYGTHTGDSRAIRECGLVWQWVFIYQHHGKQVWEGSYRVYFDEHGWPASGTAIQWQRLQ